MMKSFIAVALALASVAQSFAFDESQGFKGRVRSVNVQRQAMILEAQIEGYGEGVSVSLRPSKLTDEDGATVALSEDLKGSEVFVKYTGGFLESLPLQLMKQPEVVVLTPKVEGTISRIDGDMIWCGKGSDAFIVNVSPSTKMPKDLKVGDQIVAYFDGMWLESLPMQINAHKITRKAAPARKPGFDATVLEAREFSGKLALVCEANLPGYGKTMVSVGVKELVDEKGAAVPRSSVKAGSSVFVEHSGGFLESYPLQLGAAVRVVVKGAAAPARKPGFEARIETAEVRRGQLSLTVAGSIEGYGNGTEVMFTVGELVDEAGKAVALSAAKPGMRIFVEYEGGFLESLPLQLMGTPRVVVLK